MDFGIDIYNRPSVCSVCGGKMLFVGVGEYHCERCKNVEFDDYGKVRNYIEEHKGKCEVYAAPFAVYLDERSNTYVEPDISVICDPDKLDDRGCKGAPDWIIEIVSPASKKMDYLLKLLKYRFAGVKEYWIVDPEKNRVIVYNFTGDESVNDYTLQDFVKVGIYEDFVIDFGSMEL